MPVHTPAKLDLSADGHTIDLLASKKAAHRINVSLSDPTHFRTFSSDPKSFLDQHGVKISDELAGHLKSRLSGVGSLDQLKTAASKEGEGPACTVWAVAGGAYSVSSSKVAVAF
jgi:hypothetical protein